MVKGILQDLTPPPGFDKRWDVYTVGPKWRDGNHVRWHNGALEKIGGWTKLIETQLEGSVRAGHPWAQLDGTATLALASECNLYVYEGGTVYDITPLRLDDDALGADPFTTTNGSSVVVVAHANHGAVEGDRVTYTGQTGPINGITINTTPYTIGTILGSGTYEITDTESASGDGAGGGASVTADYTINCGSGTVVFQYGYGVGGYGAEGYGDARESSSSLLAPTLWSLDNWGEDLIAARKNGGLYTWDASAGTGTLATLITQAPSEVGLAVVSGEDRHIICFGAHDGSAYDPMLVKWCDQEDFTTWAPLITNTAGEVRLTHGSEIKAVVKTRGQILIWTDTDIYAMQFVGGRFVFAVEHLGAGVGVTGPKAAVNWNGIAYWMSRDNFYKYDGVQMVIPTPVHEYVFEEDIDDTNRDKIVAAVNKEFQEIWWFYQSNSSTTGDVDSYVKYNIVHETWDTGRLGRSAWISQGIFTHPIAVDWEGTVWEQEVDYNDNATPLEAYIETGAFEIDQGDEFIFMDKVIPDIKATGGDTYITLYAAAYPNGTEITKGPYSINDDINKINLRLRGRHFRYRLDWTDLNNDSRIGKIRASIRPDGRRQ